MDKQAKRTARTGRTDRKPPEPIATTGKRGGAGAAFARVVATDEHTRRSLERIRARLAAFGSLPLRAAIDRDDADQIAELKAELVEILRGYDDEWLVEYGIPAPQTLDEWLRLARRAGFSHAELQGTTPAEIEPEARGYLDALRDAEKLPRSRTELAEPVGVEGDTEAGVAGWTAKELREAGDGMSPSTFAGIREAAKLGKGERGRGSEGAGRLFSPAEVRRLIDAADLNHQRPVWTAAASGWRKLLANHNQISK